MDATIEGFLLHLLSITQDLPGLVAGLSPAQFNWAPGPVRWSIGQSVEHLNLTTESYLQSLRQATSEARATGKVGSGPVTLGFVERWFTQVLDPPARLRVKAPKLFVPARVLVPMATIERWRDLQAQLGACIRAAEGLDLRTIRVRSQFAPVSFSLNGTFGMLLAHQRRHLWQAREVRNDRAFPEI